MYPPSPMAELIDQPREERSDALYTVVAGEGDGFLLAMAAGDTAGGAWELGYSATTEQATMIAYELITHREIDRDRLVAALLEMDGAGGEEPVYRAESPEFRMWLDRATAGRPVAGEEVSLDAAPRAAVVGVAYRRQPDQVVDRAVELGRLFHSDAGSIAAGVITAAAVAASCFAQSGLDLVVGVAEAVTPAIGALGSGLSGVDRLASIPDEMKGLVPLVGITSGEEALARVGGDREDPIQLILAGLVLAAPVAPRHHGPIEQAARIGGSRLGAAVGAMVGARVGLRAWPWAFANDTWFAEIGRRLVRGPDEVRDLPIPYAVEQHLMSGSAPGFR